MKPHYTEADLLETYYTQPGESMPVMMHLASCTDCAARYDRLDRKLREAAACDVERPATFWSRQRLSIVRKITAMNGRRPASVRHWRAVAAALLAFLLGGAVVYKASRPEVQRSASAPAAVAVAQVPMNDVDLTTPNDAWESEELQDFQPVVQWESWVAQSKVRQGDSSL